MFLLGQLFFLHLDDVENYATEIEEAGCSFDQNSSQEYLFGLFRLKVLFLSWLYHQLMIDLQVDSSIGTDVYAVSFTLGVKGAISELANPKLFSV